MPQTTPPAMNPAPPTPASRPGPTRLRWLAAPLAAALILGAYAMVPSLAGTDSPPTLAPISARDLLVKVETASVPGLSGEITVKSRLGLPDLSQFLGDEAGIATTLLSGTHTIGIWQAGSNVRLALPSTLAESDLIRNGNDLWSWQSEGQQVHHLTLDHDRADDSESKSAGNHAAPEGAPTPEAMADHFLSSVDPTTRVVVRDTVTIADRPAYELVLAPRSGTTLVADVVVAVDSETGIPLRVQVLSRESGTPAIDVGFSSVNFSVPAASEFEFTPPPGSTVTEVGSAAELLMPSGGRDSGEGEGAPEAPRPESDKAKPRVVGAGWDSVAIIDLGSGAEARPGLDMVKKLGSPVQGAWGSGHLVSTTLVNVLLTDDNRLLIGSVPEAGLEAAAATR
ncbi:MAG: hypothetical protein ACR2HV_11725 [Acidimicrobiales bacterium]